jgi:hypothetical protein
MKVAFPGIAGLERKDVRTQWIQVKYLGYNGKVMGVLEA